MKFALVNGEKSEAKPNSNGICPICASRVIAKCGDIKIWHWSHHQARQCDTWWENETEWHRAWKNLFPIEWQEVVQHAPSGEKHIADIKTNHNWVIEFQHSFLRPDERMARNTFYQKLIWVVDGRRRKTDIKQFVNALNSGSFISKQPLIKSIFIDDCRLLKEWANTNISVFFDFGDENSIWWMFPIKSDTTAYIGLFSRKELIAIHKNGEQTKVDEFDKFTKDIPILIRNKVSQLNKYRYK